MDMKLPPVLTDDDLDRALRASVDRDAPSNLAARVMAKIAVDGPRTPHTAGWRWMLATAGSAAAAAALVLIAGSRMDIDRPPLPAPPVLARVRPVHLPPGVEPTVAPMPRSRGTRRARFTAPAVDPATAIPVLAALDAPESIVVSRLDTTPIGQDRVEIAALTVEPLRVESLDQR
jgi:hypothetical protein